MFVFSLIFSAFVAVLNVVEYFMQQIHNQDRNAAKYGKYNFFFAILITQKVEFNNFVLLLRSGIISWSMEIR